MKTITATFRDTAGATLATARASFATLPGEGEIRWQGALPVERALPPRGYSDTFEGWMRRLAGESACEVEITSEGEWKEYEE